MGGKWVQVPQIISCSAWKIVAVTSLFLFTKIFYYATIKDRKWQHTANRIQLR